MKINAIIKRFFAVIIVCMALLMFVKVDASTVNVLRTNGQVLKYDDGTNVTISTDYVQKREMRGVWVSALTGDISGFTSKEQYQKEILSVLETLEHFNMNTLIFHVRMMNDAFYESKYNSYSSYYNVNATWDPLPWIIEECHKRGIEFHAWMNPYRVTTSVASSLEDIAKKYKPSNAASNPDNLLKGTTSVILNPGLPTVKSFLVDTCLELAEKYDIDAIHFDDYFYAAGIDDSETRKQYNTTGMTTDDWRREQVNDFIEDLHIKLTRLNNETGRAVQLGIAPTGVYKNGNGIVTYDSQGNAITNGSPTRGQTHYSSYLYADTVKWINEGWIDYILPQTYWALENSACPFADLITWWDKVVKNKQVNLYAAMGLYMRTDNTSASWHKSDFEGYYQTMIVNGLDNTRGISVYNYLALRSAMKNDQSFKKVDKVWENIPILPQIRTLKSEVLPKVENLKVEYNDAGNIISWDKLDNAKFYAIYRSTEEVKFNNDEVIEVIGNLEYNGRIQFTDIDELDDDKTYYYGIKALSNNNTLGKGEQVSIDSYQKGALQYLGKFETFVTSDNLFPGEKITVRWNELSFPYGDTVKFELGYSFDNTEEVKTTNFYQSRSQYCCDVEIPKSAKKIVINLRAYNNIGETIESLSYDLKDSLQAVTNFSYLGDIFANEEVQFVWNKINDKDVKYVLQYSVDTVKWDDLKETQDDSQYFNCYFNCKTPDVTGEMYYRIKAVKGDSSSYSNVVKCFQKKSAGVFNQLKVNGEELKSFYLIAEDEELKIIWRKSKYNNEYPSYSVMYSYDLVTWSLIRTYDSGSKYEENGLECIQTIPINYNSTILYVKVVASGNASETTSEIIRIYPALIDLFLEDVLMYLEKENNAYITQMGIYN